MAKKNNIWGNIGKILILLTALSILGGGILYIFKQGQKDKEVEGRLFTTTEIRVETEKLTKVPFTPVKIYLQGDTLKDQQRFIARLLDSVNKRNKIEDSLKIIRDSVLNISREARSSDIKIILDGVIRTNNTVDKIELRQKIQGDRLDSLIKN